MRTETITLYQFDELSDEALAEWGQCNGYEFLESGKKA